VPVLLVAGVLLVVPAGEGVPASYVVTRLDLRGAWVLVLGPVWVAGATGFLAGRRRAAEPSPPPPG
jgi:hypothetical protein